MTSQRHFVLVTDSKHAIDLSEMFGDLEWLLSSAQELYLLLASVAAIAVLSIAAFSASVLVKAYSQVRGFDGPQCHWFKGHLDQVMCKRATFTYLIIVPSPASRLHV